MEASVSYFLMAVLSVALIRFAMVLLYPKQVDWDE